MWATEVKKVDIESLPKWEEKDLFRCAARLQSSLPGLACAEMNKVPMISIPYLHEPTLLCFMMPNNCDARWNVSCQQDIHGGLQHRHAAAQEVL